MPASLAPEAALAAATVSASFEPSRCPTIFAPSFRTTPERKPLRSEVSSAECWARAPAKPETVSAPSDWARAPLKSPGRAEERTLFASFSETPAAELMPVYLRLPQAQRELNKRLSGKS